MNQLGENIKAARKQKKLTQRQLADLIGAKHNSVSNWETGVNKPDSDMLARLCGALGVSPNALLGACAAPDPEASDYVSIPVVGAVKAGIPTEAVEDVLDWEDIPRAQKMRGDYIGLRVKGNSMAPRILEGDTVIIRRQETIENGETAVVFVGDSEATLKKVKIEENGIILIALNAGVYEPHFYSRQAIEELPVQIYGKVVELRGKF